MKYLIDGQRNVLRCGEYVEADEAVNEFVFDTDTAEDQKEITVAVLKSICESSGIHCNKGATRKDLLSNLETNLPTLGIPEQKTMTQSAIIKEIVTAAGEDRAEDGDPEAFEIKVFTTCINRLNAEGITFKIKQLGRLVQQEIAEQGLVVSNVQRKVLVSDICVEAKFAPNTWEQFEEMVKQVSTDIVDTNETKAISLLRKWLKENGLAVPKKTREAKKSYRQRAIDFLILNSPVTDDELTKFVTETCEKDESAIERLQSQRDVIDRAFAAGVESTIEVEEDQAKAA